MLFFNRYLRTCFPDTLPEKQPSSLSEVEATLFTPIPAKLRAICSLWTGFRVGPEGVTLDEKVQAFFQPFEVLALFTGDGATLKNKWLTEVNGKRVTLFAVLAAGVRFEIDCGGTRPAGIHGLFDPQQRRPRPESVVEFVSFEDAVAKLGLAKYLEGEEAPGKEKETSKGKEIVVAENVIEAEVMVEEKALRGSGDVGFLRVWGPGPPVLPSIERLAEALGKVKGLDEPFDLEVGGVDMVVFFARPRVKKVETAPGEESPLQWLMEEGLVRGVTERMAAMMAKGSVAVIVAPATMPKEWIVGLKELRFTSWAFNLQTKVSSTKIHDLIVPLNGAKTHMAFQIKYFYTKTQHCSVQRYKEH